MHHIRVDQTLCTQLEPQSVKQPLASPSGHASIDGLPATIPLGQVALLCAGTALPHQPVHHLPMVLPTLAAVLTNSGHEIGNQLSMSIAHLVPQRRRPLPLMSPPKKQPLP
jgi:hypothetical protein